MINLNISEYEASAKDKLSSQTLGYYNSGAGDESTLQDNRNAFEKIKILPRVLVDVSHRSLKTSILGQRLDSPIIIAPCAFQCLAHPDGELATAKAANQSRTMMLLSTLLLGDN
jgi:4-hydroxymandelate oxidase